MKHLIISLHGAGHGVGMWNHIKEAAAVDAASGQSGRTLFWLGFRSLEGLAAVMVISGVTFTGGSHSSLLVSANMEVST